MIFTKRKITITGDKASIDKQIVLYRGDREIEVQFEIVYETIKYRMSNTIEDANASFGQLVIQNNSTPIPTVTDVSPTSEGTVIFKFTKEMIDEISELGEYSFQIRLFDDTQTSRITTPIVENGIAIKEPLSIYEGNSEGGSAEVGVAFAGAARAQQEEYLEPFDEAGNYNETTWATGDIITSGKLNKLEDGITGVNQKVEGITVPTKTSELTNDSRFATETYVGNAIANAQLGSGGTSIDDTTTATNKTWSSSKIDSQIKEIANVGKPTDEQVNTAVNIYLASNPITIDNMWTDLIEGEIYEVKAPAVQIGISAVFTQGDTTIYEGLSVDSLKSMLVVTKVYNDNTTEVTNDYTLSGTLTVGTSTITVSNGTFTATFNVTVSEMPTSELTSISAVYTQTSTVTPSTPLDNLKSEIVVTANYSDGTTATITNYTLSGVLVRGTSTVTITYEGKTTTIDVNVIEDSSHTTDNLAGYYDLTGYADDNIGELYTGEDYTDSCPLYVLDLTESSGVNSGLVARAYTRNTANLSDASLLGFENGEFRSGTVVNKGGEGLTARIGINSIPYPFSIEWYGKFCGGMSSPTVDSKDTYDYPLNLFSSRSTINNISAMGSKGSTLELKDSTTLSMFGGIAQGVDTMTLSKEFNKDVYHHFVVTYNNSLFQLYVDGEMLCSSTVTQNSSVSMITPMINGVMKMLRVYKSVLSNTEVIRNYNDVLTTIGGAH